MTNFKKSFGVLAFGLLALAFCCVLIAQSALAKSESKVVTEAAPYYEEGTVPLPGTDEIVSARPEKHELRNPQEPVAMSAADLDAISEDRARPDQAASAMQGGDTYATAVAITAGSWAGTTVGYTHDYDATLCGSPNTCPDVVYSYTPSVSLAVDLSLCNSGGTDTKLWVMEYDGVSTYTEIQCNDDGDDCPVYESHIPAFEVTGGTTYFIVIGGWGNTDAGPYVLDVTEYIPGQSCEAPIAIEFDPGDGEDDGSQDYAIDVSLGGVGVSTITANPAAGSLFLQFTAEETGLFTFEWCRDGTVPVAWITGIAGAIQCPYAYALDYGNNCDPDPDVIQGVMLDGWTYEIEIFDGGEGQTGTLTVSWQEMIAYNDECVDAEDLGVGNTTAFVHNVNATLSSGFDYTWCDPVIDPGTQTCGDVWYFWEADETGLVSFDMCTGWGESGFDSKMFVYRGYSCVGDETIDPFGCSDDGCGHFGDGGFIEMECTAGEVFMIRLAGWISGDNPPDLSCAQEGGQGTGWLDIWQYTESVRPPNDNCPDAVVGVLAPGGDVYTTVSNLYMSGWGSCPDLYNTPDGSIGPGGAMAWLVFDAFSISECTDMRIDYCGTQDNNPGRVNYSNWPQGINIFTGCPCEGPFVTIPTAGGTYSGVCDASYPADQNLNRGWDYPGLLPGTYYAPMSNWYIGISSVSGDYRAPYDVVTNFRSTPVECVYCEGFSNINSCPPVAGASWIRNVSLADMTKTGVLPAEDDCLSYEDHTDLVAHVYKGITYPIAVLMGKVGTAGVHDSCDVWVDWNQNSGFAAFVPEIHERTTLSRVALNWSGNIMVPLDAMEPGEGATGTTRMRVRMASDADGMNVPCGEKVWGEVEDFTVEVSTIECGEFGTPDGIIGADDIAYLRDAYLAGDVSAFDPPVYWQRADIDGDGVITIGDVIALVDAAYHGGEVICL